jgi:hypothetical protein
MQERVRSAFQTQRRPARLLQGLLLETKKQRSLNRADFFRSPLFFVRPNATHFTMGGIFAFRFFCAAD